MFQLFGSNPKLSYYEKERTRIEILIREPLLELILIHLPHLQPTETQQEDTWEIIAIKLNNYNFERYVTDKENGFDNVEDLPTFNGPFVKDLYHKLLTTFTQNVIYVNRDINLPLVPRHELGEPTSSFFQNLKLPIRSKYTTRYEKILCELFYLDGYDIEILTKLSKERLKQIQNIAFDKHFDDAKVNVSSDDSSNEKQQELLDQSDDKNSLQVDKNDNASAFNTSFDSHQMLGRVRQQLEKERLKRYEEELVEKNKRLEHLDNENRRLLELNHELVVELQRSRDSTKKDMTPNQNNNFSQHQQH